MSQSLRRIGGLWLGGVCLLLLAASLPATVPNRKPDDMTAIKIRIADRVFTARLEDNETAAAFRAMLPLTVRMSDLNDNEKVVELAHSLPGKVSNPGTIHTGDLMIWSSRSLVLFYKTFPTPYRYARLGRIDDPTELAKAVGEGDVAITFEVP